MPGTIREGMRCTVMGLGRFGGGRAVSRWLLDHGCHVRVTDLEDEDRLRSELDALAAETTSERLSFRMGGHDLADFTACDLVIANPAVPQPWANPFLNAARDAGIPVTTEIGLVTERLMAPRVIGVTGSNGKSTTVSMIAHALNRSGTVAHPGGNLGGSLLPMLPRIKPEDWVVLELSSAMLWWLSPEAGHEWAPGIAVTTNISANHLDWHGTEDHYRATKAGISRRQPPPGLAFHGRPEDANVPLALRIPGRHNQMNAALAARVVDAVNGADAPPAASLLADFPGLPHRLEALDEAGRFINDSKATTPEATRLAIEACASRGHRLHLIVGGFDKGIPLEALADAANGLAGVYTIGTTGPALAERIGPPAMSCGHLRRAVQMARDRMGKDDILLLSPGCASWDQFPNFEARGEAFARLVFETSQRGSSGRV